MDQRVLGSEVAHQHWNYRVDLVSQSPARGEMTPAPIHGCVWRCGERLSWDLRLERCVGLSERAVGRRIGKSLWGAF